MKSQLSQLYLEDGVMSLNMISQKVRSKKLKLLNSHVEGLKSQPLGKFNYKVFYSKPASSDISLEEIVLTGYGNEFDDGLHVKGRNNHKTPQKAKFLEKRFIKEGEGKFYLDSENPNNMAGMDGTEFKNLVRDNKDEVIKLVIKEWEP